MSTKSPHPLPLKRKPIDIFSPLTKSLLRRQLLSSFIITILGLSILSGFYYDIQQKSYLKKAYNKSKSLDNEISSLIEINKETRRYVIAEPEFEETMDDLIDKNHLASDNDNYFAYIINEKTNELLWHSLAYKNISDENIGTPPYTKEVLDVLPIFPHIHAPKDENTLKILTAKNTLKEGRNRQNKLLVYYNIFIENGQTLAMVIAQSPKEMEKQKTDTLQKIGILILISSLLVLAAQLVNSYLVITPIKRFEKEIKNIESGKQEFVKASYPTELFEVKGAINALVQVEKGQKKRYREALDNLAHSLKTPLAVLQGCTENNNTMSEKQSATLINQVTRMNDIIAYQLRRAVVNDHNSSIQRIDIRPILYRLKTPLLKVHHEKTFQIEINVDEHTECRMNLDDLMEVFGNLINNACRFCTNIVVITATHDGDFVIVDIDDDGLGFPDINPSSLLKRGIRADNKTEGQGIGLAISNEIVEAAGGRIELLVSPYVGARVRLYLPS